MQVLAGDIGGTKTLLAICEVSPPGSRTGAPSVEVLASRRYESRSYPGPGAICRSFATEVGRPMPKLAGFGVAGPVANGRSHTTNLPWVVEEAELAEALQVDSVRLANDFHTLALGIPALKPMQLSVLNDGIPEPDGPWAVIGAGTGLGEAVAILSASGQREVLATEGGHCSFAPRTEREIGILRFLQKRYDHVSWERLVSGDGLVNIVEALADLAGQSPPAAVAAAIARDRPTAPPGVTAAAEAGDPLCREALHVFCALYGAEAGNLALKSLATGGVFIGGGIAPKIRSFMEDGRFREAFFAKGRMRPLLERIPVKIVLDGKVGLLGAAALAARPVELAPRKKNPPQ